MSDATLVITKVLNAPVEDVFDAWIDPKQVVEWYCPEGFTNTIHTFEVREGGEYRLTMHAPNGEDHPLKGTFKKIDRPHKLSFTWQWEGSGEGAMGNRETLVSVEFKAKGDKTEMTMTHSGFANVAERDNHNKGWSSSFNKLEKTVA